ncbi:hypothetical protein Taro_056525 [Colocasia esculenta]|uniref:Glycosyltransferase N-terminal domain-containing protein n=1 Tax=Colocasia esculenta TaxID=4460 RepID=A0A843XWP7_COLES|nr:hypothetical protein [Colocasia esculenta]
MEKEQEENAGRAHVVLLPFPAQGHVNPMLEFGKRLAARGLPVTLAITRFVARSMPQPEMTGVVRVVGNISDGHDEGGLAEAESVQSYLDGFKAAGSRTLAELIREEDARGRPVRGVVYDSHLPWVPDVAKGMGLLAAAFFTQSCAVSAVYHHAHHGLLPVPPPGPTVSIEGLPALRLDETSSFISRPGHYPEFLESVVNQYLNLEKADAVFVNTFYHLEPQVRPLHFLHKLERPLRDFDVWGGSPMLAKGWTIDVQAPTLNTYGERPIKPMDGPKPSLSHERPIWNPGLDNEISMPGYMGPDKLCLSTGTCAVIASFPPLKACLGDWRYVPFGLRRDLAYTIPFGAVSVMVGVYRTLPYRPR